MARKIKRDKKKREFRPSQNEQRREIRCVEWKAELAALQKRWKEKAAAKKAEKEVMQPKKWAAKIERKSKKEEEVKQRAADKMEKKTL